MDARFDPRGWPVVIDLLDACDSACMRCCRFAPLAKAGEFAGPALTVEQARRLAEALRPISPPRVTLQGGEPSLLGPRLLEIVKAFRESGVPRVAVTTHGGAFMDDADGLAAAWAAAGVTDLFLSIGEQNDAERNPAATPLEAPARALAAWRRRPGVSARVVLTYPETWIFGPPGGEPRYREFLRRFAALAGLGAPRPSNGPQSFALPSDDGNGDIDVALMVTRTSGRRAATPRDRAAAEALRLALGGILPTCTLDPESRIPPELRVHFSGLVRPCCGIGARIRLAGNLYGENILDLAERNRGNPLLALVTRTPMRKIIAYAKAAGFIGTSAAGQPSAGFIITDGRRPRAEAAFYVDHCEFCFHHLTRPDNIARHLEHFGAPRGETGDAIGGDEDAAAGG
jgi:hypothetical protein